MAFVQKLIVVTAAAWLVTGCADVAQQQGADPAELATHTAPSAGDTDSTPEAAYRRVGRYTAVLAEPAAAVSDPLGVYVRISYPRQTVRTVGDAIEHTLLRTGWRLADRGTFEQAAAHYMTLPLPESQRVLGPYPVRTVLRVLADGSWQWHEDPVRRLTWFTLAQAAQPPAPAPAANAPAAPALARQPEPAIPTAVESVHVVATPLTSPEESSEPAVPTAGAAAPETRAPAAPQPACECD